MSEVQPYLSRRTRRASASSCATVSRGTSPPFCTPPPAARAIRAASARAPSCRGNESHAGLPRESVQGYLTKKNESQYRAASLIRNRTPP